MLHDPANRATAPAPAYIFTDDKPEPVKVDARIPAVVEYLRMLVELREFKLDHPEIVGLVP